MKPEVPSAVGEIRLRGSKTKDLEAVEGDPPAGLCPRKLPWTTGPKVLGNRRVQPKPIPSVEKPWQRKEDECEAKGTVADHGDQTMVKCNMVRGRMQCPLTKQAKLQKDAYATS